MKHLVFLMLIVVLGSCGKDDAPTPKPDPIKTFEFKSDAIEIKGVVKTVTVEEAKAVIGLTLRDLEN